jgi:hypothetical protein
LYISRRRHVRVLSFMGIGDLVHIQFRPRRLYKSIHILYSVNSTLFLNIHEVIDVQFHQFSFKILLWTTSNHLLLLEVLADLQQSEFEGEHPYRTAKSVIKYLVSGEGYNKRSCQAVEIEGDL